MEPSSSILHLLSLSQEIICRILSFLPLKEVLAMAMLCRKVRAAVQMHLLLRKQVDFCEGMIYGWMPASISDYHLMTLLRKCPKLEAVYGLHPVKVERRWLRKRSTLSINGIIEALADCPSLKKVETSNLKLLEALSLSLPHLEIMGHFRNRDGSFPPRPAQHLKLTRYPRITSLHLIGVQVPELTPMLELQDLHLQWVCFTKLHPFRSFSAPKLRTFTMKQCMGPAVPVRYMPLFAALSCAPELSRMELVRLPLPGGLIQRAVEGSWNSQGFKKLVKLVVGDCKGILESDLGYLLITASQSLETICIQPSLTKDSLFVSLHFAHCDFARLKTLQLGYMDDFPSREDWTNDFLMSQGLADALDVPSSVTDSGMKVVSQLFPNVKSLMIANCPHIMDCTKWTAEGNTLWQGLTTLTLRRCHCLRLPTFSSFLSELEDIETLILKDMFRELPKGCSQVGLSAGTGLGLSSVIVTTHNEQLQDQAQQQDAQEPDLLDQAIANAEHLIHENDINNHRILQQHINEENINDHMQEANQVLFGQRNPENFDVPNNCSSEPGVSSGSSVEHCSNHNNVKSVQSKKRRQASVNIENPSHQPDMQDCDIICNSKRAKISRASCSSKRSPANGTRTVEAKNIQKQSTSTACDLEKPSTSKHYEDNCDLKSNNDVRKTKQDDTYEGPLTRFRKHKLAENTQNSAGLEAVDTSILVPSLEPAANNSAGTSAENTATQKARSKGVKKHKVSKSKATRASTDSCKKRNMKDALLEEDVTQVFWIASSSLRSLTVVACGVSEITTGYCPNLLHIEAQACRILKRCMLRHCLSLIRVNIVQCPKLNIYDFMTGIMNLENERPVICYIEPCVKNPYSRTLGEETILTPEFGKQSIALVHDYSTYDDDRGAYREMLLGWLRVLQQITSFIPQKLSRHALTHSNQKYLEAYSMDRIYGKVTDGLLEIVTNSHLLALLLQRNKDCGEDFSSPDSPNCNSIPELVSSLQLEIAELFQTGLVPTTQFIAFYIHIVDANSSR